MENKQEEVKVPRSLEEINKEYGQACAALGEKTYRLQLAKSQAEDHMGTLRKEIEELSKKIFDLNQEGFAAQKKKAAPDLTEKPAEVLQPDSVEGPK